MAKELPKRTLSSFPSDDLTTYMIQGSLKLTIELDFDLHDSKLSQKVEL